MITPACGSSSKSDTPVFSDWCKVNRKHLKLSGKVPKYSASMLRGQTANDPRLVEEVDPSPPVAARKQPDDVPDSRFQVETYKKCFCFLVLKMSNLTDGLKLELVAPQLCYETNTLQHFPESHWGSAFKTSSKHITGRHTHTRARTLAHTHTDAHTHARTVTHTPGLQTPQKQSDATLLNEAGSC